MKIVKWIISMILFALCFIFTSEFYQFYLDNFTNGYYCAYKENSNIYADKYSEIVQICDENEVGIFLVKYTTTSVSSEECHIYASELAIKELYDSNIKVGTYKGLLSGRSDVVIHEISEYAENSELLGNLPFYFTGELNNIRLARKNINKEAKIISALDRNISIHSWAFFSAWAIVLAFILLLTWFCLQFDIKRVFVRISLGASKFNTAGGFMLLDAGIFIAEFLVCLVILNKYFYVSYNLKYSVVMFIAFIIINSLIYLTIFRYTYKEIFSGANLNQKLLATCYPFKLIIMILTLGVVAFNVSIIFNYSHYLSSYKDINALDEYYTLKYELQEMDFEESKAHQENSTGRLFVDNYLDGKVLLASVVSLIEDDDGKSTSVLLFNDNAKELIHSEEILEHIETADFYLFYPAEKSCSLPEDCLFSQIEYVFGIDPESISYEEYSYSDNVSMMYFDLVGAEYGFDIADNPVLIYCNISTDKLQTLMPSVPPISIETFTTLYKVKTEDITTYQNKYKFKSLERSSIVDMCNKYRNLFIRRILLSSVLSGLLIFIELSIVIAISRLEYMVNSKLLAIKTILGHGMLKKSLSIIVTNIIVFLIGIVAVTLLAVMTEYTKWYFPIGCSAVFIILEFVILLTSLASFEKSSEIKILKGGSL